MTISIYNPNADPITKTALSNILPDGLTIAQTPNIDGSLCGDEFVIANASANNFSVTGATIPAAGSCIISVDVVSNVFGTYDDNIPVGNITSLEGVSNGAQTDARIIYSDSTISD